MSVTLNGVKVDHVARLKNTEPTSDGSVPCCADEAKAAGPFLPGLPDLLPGPWTRRGTPGAVGHCAKCYADELKRLAMAPMDPPPMADTQALLTCGEGRYWPGIVVLVKMLRHECGVSPGELPVEVWHRPSHGAVNPADVAGLGVTFVDADERARRFQDNRVPEGQHNLGGWESKLYALAHTRHRHVFFMDADAYPVSDPRRAIDRARDKGFVFWSETQENVRWEALGFAAKPQSAPPSIQGGQFALDRRAVWRELAIAHWICQHSDFYWPRAWPHGLMFGDQDAWRVAFALTGRRPHAVAPCEYHPHWGYVCWMDGVTVAEHRCFQKLVPIGTVGESRALRYFADHMGAGQTPGWLTGEEAALLRDACRGRRVLEWGRFHGRSTAVIAAVGEHVWSVDRLPHAPAAAHLAGLGLADRATLVTADYTDPATRPPWPPDVVFVDGEHHRAAVLRDLAAAAELVARGGVVALHDYGDPNAPDVRPAADEWAAANNWHVSAQAGTLAVMSASAP